VIRGTFAASVIDGGARDIDCLQRESDARLFIAVMARADARAGTGVGPTMTGRDAAQQINRLTTMTVSSRSRTWGARRTESGGRDALATAGPYHPTAALNIGPNETYLSPSKRRIWA
jgi:hypothetical protein